MNPKVEQWLQAQKAAQAASKRANREKHLIEIGLLKDNSVRYTDEYGYTLTEEQYNGYIAAGLTAHKTQEALDVTDEEYAEICKYTPEKNITDIPPKNITDIPGKNNADGVSNRAERGIVKFANVVKTIGMILWIILALIGLIGGLVVAEASWSFPAGLFIAYFFGGVFSGFICWLGCYLTWAVLKVFTNISNTLYRLEAKRE
ncbi:hypothetical protein HDR65_02255 [bacterium]|nr:hypothetical protein [bacterium]